MTITTYVFDMDGVLYRGNTPIPGAVSMIAALQQNERKIYFLTNNSGNSRADYQAKLANMGIDVTIDQIFTSAYATAIYLQLKGASGKKAFVIGESGIAAELAAVGIEAITKVDLVPCTQIDYVIVGIDRGFTYDKLRYAHACIARGHAVFIATNRDPTYPVEDGTIPGAGSVVAGVVTATGLEPITIGKPEPHALEAILVHSGSTADETIMIGDRLDTDIAAGNNVGTHTALVLTGVSTKEEAQSAEGLLRPELIIGNLSELLES